MARQGTVAHAVSPGGGAQSRVARRRAPSRMRGMEVDPSGWPAAGLLALAKLLAGYHRYRVQHLERLGRVLRAGRRVILVGNHALDVIDPLLFISALLGRYGRVPRIIGHRSWFRLPVVRLADAGDGMRYRGAPLRFGLLGPHLLPGVFPLPVQLTHVVSPRLPLGNRALALRDPAVFERLHRTVWRRCQTFLARAVARR